MESKLVNIEQVSLQTSTSGKTLDAIERGKALFSNESGLEKITSGTEQDYMVDLLKSLKTIWKGVEEDRKILTKPFRENEAEINLRFKTFTDFVNATEKAGKKAMAEYIDGKRKVEAASQAKAEENARRKKEKLEVKAEQAESEGRSEIAEDLLDRADNIEVKDHTTERNRGEGRALEYDITDTGLFFCFCANDPYLSNLLSIKDGEFKKYLKMLSNSNRKRIPGVLIKTKTTVALR